MGDFKIKVYSLILIVVMSVIVTLILGLIIRRIQKHRLNKLFAETFMPKLHNHLED